MKKTFKLEDLCCAHCAQRMEDNIKKIDGISSASINFVAAKLVIETEEDIKALIPKIKAAIELVEPDCTLIV